MKKVDSTNGKVEFENPYWVKYFQKKRLNKEV